MKPFQRKVSFTLGRRSDRPEDFRGRVHLSRVPFVDGDYDPGGAYWGGGPMTLPLFCFWDDEGHALYLRARDRDEAKSKHPELCYTMRMPKGYERISEERLDAGQAKFLLSGKALPRLRTFKLQRCYDDRVTYIECRSPNVYYSVTFRCVPKP